MKVAIIGAGPAGLCCAYGLEKYGITPDIYEKNSMVGNPFGQTLCSLRIVDKISRNPRKYFKHKYGLAIKPLFPLTEITMISKDKKTTIKGGTLGYAFCKSLESNSIENQIAQKVISPITFNADVDFDEIINCYDFVVNATGNCDLAKHMGIWTTTTNTISRVGKVLGNFKPGTIKMWIDTNYSKNCYCYLLPKNDKAADLVLSLNDASNGELEFYWKNFLLSAGIEYIFLETWDTEQNIGSPVSAQFRNILFAGNSGGFMDDFLGFGLFKAMESGMLAAKAIGEGLDYNKLTQPLKKYINTVHHLREAVSTFDNNDYNRLVSFLGMPGIKTVLYKHPIITLKQGGLAARLYSSIKGR